LQQESSPFATRQETSSGCALTGKNQRRKRRSWCLNVSQCFRHPDSPALQNWLLAQLSASTLGQGKLLNPTPKLHLATGRAASLLLTPRYHDSFLRSLKMSERWTPGQLAQEASFCKCRTIGAKALVT